MTVTLVDLAPDQRTAALAEAHAAKVGAAAVRRELRVGELTVAAALEDPRSGSLTLDLLLRAVPGIGRAKIPGILRKAGVLAAGSAYGDPTKRVGSLTARQRRDLAVQAEACQRQPRTAA